MSPSNTTNTLPTLYPLQYILFLNFISLLSIPISPPLNSLLHSPPIHNPSPLPPYTYITYPFHLPLITQTTIPILPLPLSNSPPTTSNLFIFFFFFFFFYFFFFFLTLPLFSPRPIPNTISTNILLHTSPSLLHPYPNTLPT